LSKGLVGQANAYLLGGLLVSKFYQTTIARQSRQRENRKPYMLLMDEAGELLTSTISEILVGARKYGLGLTLAHQSLRQLTGDDEVYGAVTGSCGTKICFQVGGDDARKMADEFGGFVAADLMNLPKLHAIARVGPRDASFNLETHFIPQPDRPAEEAYADLRERTRRRYATRKAEIRKELEALREFLPKKKAVDPFAELTAKQKRERQERDEPSETTASGAEAAPSEGLAETTESVPLPRPAPFEPPAPRRPSRPPPPVAPIAESGDLETGADAAGETPELKTGKAESIKNALIQTAGSWGFSYETEFQILGGAGRVDIVLRRGDLIIACEISATTSAPHEVENVLKCLKAGYSRIFHVCDATPRQRRLAALLTERCGRDDLRRVEFLTTQSAVVRLGELASAAPAASAGNPPEKSEQTPSANLSAEDRERAKAAAWAKIRGNMARDRPHPGSEAAGSE
jgi:hypothetical protein